MREMKSSGVDWIGDIPVDWKAIPIKYNYEIIAGATPSSNISEYWDGQINWITPADFKTEDIYVAKGNRRLTKLGYVSCSTTMIPSGNIIFSKRAPIGTVAINAEKVCTNQGCFGLIPKNKNINNKFYYYAISVYPEVFNLFGSGTTFREISAVAFGNIKLPFPNINTQKSITVYLDNKCERIDAIITDIQSEIDTLEKYKRSVITEAVTQGLDKDVEMKDSGIEWIGKIPYTWHVGRIKFYIDKVGSGKTPKGDENLYTQGEILFLRSQNIFDTGIVLDEEPTVITDAIDAEMANTRVLFGDVLLNITGGSIGRCCIYKFKNRANVNQHVCIIRTKKDKILPAYMHYFWISNLGQTAINLYQTGGNREGMSADAIKNTPIPIMSIQEQKDIVQHLDDKCSNIDIAVSQKQNQLNILNNYKKSLIYEYVTGKKEVPSSWQN